MLRRIKLFVEMTDCSRAAGVSGRIWYVYGWRGRGLKRDILRFGMLLQMHSGATYRPTFGEVGMKSYFNIENIL